ncbi:unnamed protein product [Rotaria sordida]|uniref:Uncharacterized protein n=1 Tax=Rotaria sordida TaxID=392033 RepID=A0A819E4Z7_9BILA|nr:unnamed protein product [Rotaria sordida]CAF1354231.1 unnamed protein product [Rotaria sordida]CAF1380648.1 unnamed protein product [Rotaria sordida]CAF3844240.1 unnamed protein product [Rotaria sordida]CAF4072369.1 unnamed protein product [Rotaria sordida]
MTSLNVALSFLSHIGFSHSNACDLMTKMDNDMSRLMICSNKELIQYNLSFDIRLRLLRAIRCFHMEKWSKYLMNNFYNDKNLNNIILCNYIFEKLIYHLIKYHIWIIYTSWTLIYIRKYLIITKDINQENIRLFYEKIQRLKNIIIKLKQIIIMIKKHLS